MVGSSLDQSFYHLGYSSKDQVLFPVTPFLLSSDDSSPLVTNDAPPMTRESSPTILPADGESPAAVTTATTGSRPSTVVSGATTVYLVDQQQADNNAYLSIMSVQDEERVVSRQERRQYDQHKRPIHGRPTWAAAVVAVAATLFLAAAYLLVVLVVRSCRLHAAIHDALSLLLLVAVAVQLVSVVLYVVPPSDVVCPLQMLVPPLSLVVCFSLLLVQMIETSHRASTGGRTAQLPLYLTVVLSVAVQASVSWAFFSRAPTTRESPNDADFGPGRGYLAVTQWDVVGGQCALVGNELVLVYCYPVVLVVLVAVYGAARGLCVRQRRFECVGAFVCALLVVSWAAACSAHLVEIRLQQPATCSLLVVVAAVLLLFVFVPKIISLQKDQQVVVASSASSLGRPKSTLRALDLRALSGKDLMSHPLYLDPLPKIVRS